MKQMLKWTADHGSLMMSADAGETLMEKAASCAKSYHDQGLNLAIDLVDVEDRVVERAHSTGIKVFDALLRKNQGTFHTGNVYGDAQLSQFVRGLSNTECNGMTFASGELRKADLKLFDMAGAPFAQVKDWLKSHPDGDTIVYGFRHKIKPDFTSSAERLVYGFRQNIAAWRWHGFLVTDTQHNLLYRDHRSDIRSERLLDEAEHFVTNSHHHNPVPLVRIQDGQLDLLTPEIRAAYDQHGEAQRSRSERESA